MVNVKGAIAFGLLAVTASAASVHKDKRHVHHRRHHTKKPCSSVGSPYPVGNSTQPAGTGLPQTSAADTSATSTPTVVTVSVVPVPITTPQTETPQSTVASTSPAGGAPSSPAGSDCGAATTYVTVQETITVTAGQVPDTTSSVAAATTSSSSTSSTTSSTSSLSSYTAQVSAIIESSLSTPVASAGGLLQTGGGGSPAPSSTSSVAPVSSSPSGGYSGAKMGVSWIPGVPFSSLGFNAPWAYDWGQVGSGIPAGTAYVPTLHDSSKCAGFADQLASQSGISYVKHFNEPDMSGGGGSGMSVGEAVSLHNQYIAPLMGKYNIGLPAVTSDNVPGVSGTGYLQSFVQQLGSCKGFAFADFHFYGGDEAVAQQAQIFLGYVDNWISVVDELCPGQNLPIWITEFSAGPVADGDAGKAAEFMAVAGPALLSNHRVERFAYFIPSNGQLSAAVSSINSAIASH